MGMCTFLRLAPVLFTTWSQFACPDRHKEHVDVSAAPFSVAFGALGICFTHDLPLRLSALRAVSGHERHVHVSMACQSSAICEMPTIRRPFVGFICHPGIGLGTARQSGFLPNLLLQRDMCSSSDTRSRTDKPRETTSMLLPRCVENCGA